MLIDTPTSLPAELQTALILTLITSVVAPLLLLLINRVLNHKSNDIDVTKKALDATAEAVNQLNDAREALRKRDNEIRQMDVIHRQDIASLNGQITQLTAAITGKYRVTLEFMTGPNPSIISTHIILVPETMEALPTVVDPADED